MSSDGRYGERGSEPRSPALALTGAVLAGGASRRFGSDKATFVYRGRTLLQHALGSLGGCDEVLVVGGRVPPGVEGKTVADVRRGFGAASGLHACLVHARHDWVAVVACDMPFVPPAIWTFLLARAGARGEEAGRRGSGPSSDGGAFGSRRTDDLAASATGASGATAPGPLVVMPEGPAGLEPLVALYHRGLLPVLASALDRGGIALRDLLHLAPARVVRWEEVRTAFGARVFVNVNRPEDLP